MGSHSAFADRHAGQVGPGGYRVAPQSLQRWSRIFLARMLSHIGSSYSPRTGCGVWISDMFMALSTAVDDGNRFAGDIGRVVDVAAIGDLPRATLAAKLADAFDLVIPTLHV